VACVFSQLEEIWKLRPLNNLVELSISDNPVTRLPHCRLYVIFHLRTVDILDGQSVSADERQAAHSRFAQGYYTCYIRGWAKKVSLVIIAVTLSTVNQLS